MSRRSPGEGSFSRRTDGRWQASLQVNGIRRTVYGKTRSEAQAKLRELQREADEQGDLNIPEQRTVGDLFDVWLERAPDLKETTIASYREFLDIYVQPVIGDTQLDQVTPAQLQRLYSQLTPSVAEKIHRLLHRAFAVAVLWGWLKANPCDRVLRPTYKTQAKTLWTLTELSQFLEQTTEHWLHPLWVILIATGCRIGEALALHWHDIGPDGASLSINGTLHRVDGTWVIDTPKTASSARIIRLPTDIVDTLHVQKHQQDAWRESAGAGWEDWGLVFTGQTGKPLFASTVQHAIKRVCARLGLPIITPHSLRHLHASLLLDRGVPVTAVSARLGHANPQITMKIYAHALPGQDKRAADAIGDVLGGNGETESGTELAE